MEHLSFVWLLLLVLRPIPVSCEYDLSDDGAHGVRISGNDLFTVFARNSELRYEFTFANYNSCDTSYTVSSNYYVYSLAVLNNNSYLTSPPNFTFLQVAETMTSEPEVILSVMNLQRGPYCDMISLDDFTVLKGTHQMYMQIKIDPRNQYAYVVADSFILSFDIAANKIIELKNSSILFHNQYYPRAFDLTDTWAIVTGIELTHRYYVYLSYLVLLRPLVSVAYLGVPDNTVHNIAKLKIYDRTNDMSVAVNARSNMTLISFPARQRVLVIDVNPPNDEKFFWTMTLKHETNWPTANMGFGRSLAWIDDETVAVTMFTVVDRPWSRSEVWMFAVDKPFDKPLFVFPNNQQVVMLIHPPLFLHILSWSNNLYVLTDQSKVLLIPTRPAGFLSVWKNNDKGVLAYESAPCIGGTYKNRSSVGPCTACPAQTKNSGDEKNKPSMNCIACPSNSFCPVGSVNVVSLDALPSYVQSYSYPDSPDVNNYDDILLKTIFEFDRPSECLVLSPMFWTLLAVGLCFIIWLIMIWLKSNKVNAIIQWRRRTKVIFKKIDPLNQDRQWVGGLLAFAIVILLGFVYWFAITYLQSYPIETVNSKRSTCSDTRRNSEFDNALQLPLPSVDGKNWKIFEMLNKQRLTMSVDLVNTAVHCSNITVRQIIPRGHYLNVVITECKHQTLINATRSFTFDLPSHPTTVELNIYGPYFIGAIRFCLRGPGLKDNLGHTLQFLDVCQLYSNDNQTLGRMLTLSIVLIKTINQTQPLESGDTKVYHGRWTPTWNDVIGLSDELLWKQYGQHLRYASDRSTVVISVSEQPFFLQNNQKPIVRKAELIFHTMLFTSLVIQLFAIGFSMVKIIIIPLTRIKAYCWTNLKRNTAFPTAIIASSPSLPHYQISSDTEMKPWYSPRSICSNQQQHGNGSTNDIIIDVDTN